MANIIKHKRRNSGGTGAPASLASGELAFNEVDSFGVVGYYGLGDNGSGIATSIIAILGAGAFMSLSGAQTVNGSKIFTSSPIIPTVATSDNSQNAASTAFVYNQFPTIGAPGTYTKVTVNSKGLITGVGSLSSADIPNLTANKITDFDTQVRTNRLDQLAIPQGPINLNGQFLNNLPEPTSSQHPATKNYVDNIAQGIDAKQSVRLATTGALPTYTFSANTITASGNGSLNLDGVNVLLNNRVLVKDEGNAQYNGIYVVTATGGASAPFILTRASDFNTWNYIPGAFTFVEEGVGNSDSGWISTANAGGTLNTTAISFVQFSSAGVVTAGNGLTKNGNVLSVVGTANRITISGSGVDIASNYSGQSTITTLGTIGSGVWRATAIELDYGGTGTNLTGLAVGALIKKVSSTALGAAVAGTDFLDLNSTIDGGSF